MVYYNSDGNRVRCAVRWALYRSPAYQLGIVDREMTFKAVDGIHGGPYPGQSDVALHMQDVNQIDFWRSIPY